MKYLPQEPDLDASLSVMENIRRGIAEQVLQRAFNLSLCVCVLALCSYNCIYSQAVFTHRVLWCVMAFSVRLVAICPRRLVILQFVLQAMTSCTEHDFRCDMFVWWPRQPSRAAGNHSEVEPTSLRTSGKTCSVRAVGIAVFLPR